MSRPMLAAAVLACAPAFTGCGSAALCASADDCPGASTCVEGLCLTDDDDDEALAPLEPGIVGAVGPGVRVWETIYRFDGACPSPALAIDPLNGCWAPGGTGAVFRAASGGSYRGVRLTVSALASGFNGGIDVDGALDAVYMDGLSLRAGDEHLHSFVAGIGTNYEPLALGVDGHACPSGDGDVPAFARGAWSCGRWIGPADLAHALEYRPPLDDLQPIFDGALEVELSPRDDDVELRLLNKGMDGLTDLVLTDLQIDVLR